MRRLVPSLFVALALILAGAIATAQTKAPLKPKAPLKTKPTLSPKAPDKPKAPLKPKVPSTTSSPQVQLSEAQTACMSRAAVLGQEQQRLDDYKSDLVGVQTEMKQLQRRLKELRVQQAETKRLVRNQDLRVRKIRQVYDKQCKKNENCDQYEAKASSIERQSKPTEDAIERIRKEIIDTHKTMATLQKQIVPLRKRYNDNKCQALVPGQTTQATIDTCYETLGDWNKLQQTLNRHSDRLPQLRSSYKRYLSRLDSLNKQADVIEGYLAKNCKDSPKMKSMNRFDDVRKRAMELGKDLDALTRTLSTLRKERITGP